MWCQEPMSSWHHSCPGKEVEHDQFLASYICDFLCIGGFVSPDHCLNWDESSKLTGFPAMWQNFRRIVLELELNSLTDIDVTIFLFQIETKTNPGFCYFCPKQCIYLCMVLVVIMKDKILWILFRHLHLCICDFPILVMSNLFGTAH